MTKKEQLIQWLGDAHAMEVGIVSTLEKHIADAKGQPKVRAALTKHLAETKRHAKGVKEALESLGGSHPVLREGVSKLANLAAGLVTTAAPDTIVKNAIADFATENFEIACYTSLILTATGLGEKKIAATCKAILKEEQAMAKTLLANFELVNSAYLSTLEEGGEDAAEDKPEATGRKVVRSSPNKKASRGGAARKSSARPASKRRSQ